MTSTLVVSDLHLGGAYGAAVLERPVAQQALFKALRDVERLVLLGDVLELRHGPRREALARARPFFERLGEAFAGREVVVLAGNHDHAVVETWLRSREEAPQPSPLAIEHRFEAVDGSAMLAAIAQWAHPARVSGAYPGLWLREDVYLTHGHQLDCHLTIPTMERLGIGVTARVLQRSASELTTPADYEAITAPVYAWIDAVARQASTGNTLNGQSTVKMWRALGGDRPTSGRRERERHSERDGRGEHEGRRERDGRDKRDGDRASNERHPRDDRQPVVEGALGFSGMAGFATLIPALRRRLIAGGFPVAIAALNRLGLGSFNADISAPELRRAGLNAMGEVAARLGLGDAHVVFGHTHRAGPLPKDDQSEWHGPAGARLMNTGCWTYDAYFLGGAPGESPYWPGGAVLVDNGNPPVLRRLLEDCAREQLEPRSS